MNVINPSWDTLPQEIWLNIFERIPFKAQVSLGCTCKKLYKLSVDHFLANAEERAWLYLNKETPLPFLLVTSIRTFLIPEAQQTQQCDLRFARDPFFVEQARREKAVKKLVEEQLRRMEGLRKLRIAGNQRTKLWGVPLSDIHEFVVSKNLEELQAPLSFFTYKDQKGWSLLHLAVSQGNRKLVSSILSQLEGDLVDVEGYNGGTGQGTLIGIDRETIINSRDENGKTPLQIALDREDQEIALFLLKKGCTTQTYTLTKENPDPSFLSKDALSYGSHLAVDFLMDLPAFFTEIVQNQKLVSMRFTARFFKDTLSATSEEIALGKYAEKIEWEKRESFFRHLAQALEENASLLILDLREYSRMAGGNEQEFFGGELKSLFRCKRIEEIWFPPFFLNYLDASGQSPLHWAVALGNCKLAQSLIAQGVPLSGKDHQGHTPISLARMLPENQIKMLSLLEKAKEAKLAVAFGKKEWERYFGSVGKEPPLPSNILEILESPCPIWSERQPEKKVIDTHILTLIPEKVDGKVLTLNYLKELIQRPKGGGNKAQYSEHYEMSYLPGEVGDRPSGFANGASHWVLMTKDVVPKTRQDDSSREGWEEVERLEEHSENFKAAGYKHPKALDTAVCILMEYVRNGTRFYTNEVVLDSIQGTYTLCSDSIWEGSVIIGGFKHSEIIIVDSRCPDVSTGLALMRTL